VQVDENAPAGVEQSANGDADHPHILAKGLEAPERPSELTFSAPSVDGDEEIHIERADGAADGNGAAGTKQNRAERRAQKKGNRR
jgi:preprotein translocase subunit SecA